MKAHASKQVQIPIKNVLSICPQKVISVTIFGKK